ncbi:hypothetical protein KHQ06_25430 [Nocardia tengchongensis]|uniref:Uncharacterized protein n=1 Tax=Nocardia tengchongensis TaxID=2055889 RepID=A0ABX8CIC9_9NOCA|nr:hypothetical protein [Nocardia tengchongensis]QVI19685.1 hypothetical protein KHQ06_25430 [Nocardia tengchongensis]
MPDEEQLPSGPRRELIAAVHSLYSDAGKPSVRSISEWIRDQDDLPSTLSHQGVAAVLKGQVARWDNLEALVYVLADHRRVRQSDPRDVVEWIHALWANLDDTPTPDTAPVFTESPSQGAAQTATPVHAADTAERAPLPSSEDDDFPVATALEEIRAELIAAQHWEHKDKLDVYRRILTSRSSREALIDALHQATEDECISKHGVRVRVWETDLYYRFVALVLPSGRQLVVQLETTDGQVISDCHWEPAEAPGHFYGRLVAAVRAAGRDLGVGLNDPTESVQRLSEMLVEIARLRAQKLRGYRYTIWRVVQKEDVGDGWYLTETALIPADDPSYEILYTRLDEIDWEQHLYNKGWHGAERAIRLARLVQASLTS